MARRFGWVLAAGLALHAPPARAETPPTLARAEAAYVAVDFESTKTLAHDALWAGGNEPATTLRLYTLLGIAASALGDEETARAAFRYVVALDPRGHLDKALSPKIRGPYLEVRGQLGAGGELAPLEARLTHQAGKLGLELSDPAGVAQATDVSYRAEHARAFVTARVAPGTVTVGQLAPSATRAEYQLVVRDEHENALYRRGTVERPELIVLATHESAADGPIAEPPASPRPYYLASGLLAAAGVSAVGAGAYFTVQREQAAQEWNGASCEQPGATRGQQCASVDERRARAEHLAIGFYVGGGAFLAGSLVTLLLAPSGPSDAPRHARLPCAPGVAPLGAACTLSF